MATRHHQNFRSIYGLLPRVPLISSVVKAGLLLVAVSGFFATGTANAQYSSEFYKLHQGFYRLLDPNLNDLKLNYFYEPSHEEKGGPGEFDLHNFSGQVSVPLTLNRDLVLRLGGRYDNRYYDFKRVPLALTSTASERLQEASVFSELGLFLTENWYLQGQVSAGAYSDFQESVEQDDIRVFAKGMLVYRINPGTQILFGVARSEDFDDVPILPLFGFRVVSNDGQLHLSLTAPLEARIGFNPNSNTELYLRGSIKGNEYRANVGSLSERISVSVRDQRVGTGIVVWFNNALNVNVEGGAAIGSQLDLKTAGAGQFDGDLKTSPYLNLGLGANF